MIGAAGLPPPVLTNEHPLWLATLLGVPPGRWNSPGTRIVRRQVEPATGTDLRGLSRAVGERVLDSRVRVPPGQFRSPIMGWDVLLGLESRG